MARSSITVVALGALGASSQQIGTNVQEQHPPMPVWTCTTSGCTKSLHSITLDANWRWINNGQYTNCYTDSSWDPSLCPDPETCARNCHLDGVSSEQYQSTYGILAEDEGLKLEFVKETQYGSNYGSRVYLMEDDDTYKLFKLKNKEFAMNVDMSRMPCGLNSAVYFVEMDADGGKSRSGGNNKAGAAYGTGYCDAQCPHDLKFVNGIANSAQWNSTANPPVGKFGMCCAEMDIWEANSRATAYTPHPCSVTGPLRCSGKDCGDNDSDERYQGVCDKDGCDWNSYRMGDRNFFGRHDDFEVDSTQEVTIVTQFITHDGTDNGDLVDIKRFYVQGGKVVPNSESTVAGIPGNSITDQTCSDMKRVFGDINDFQRNGGLKAMGDALDRANPATPGVARGPCKSTTGTPAYVRQKYPTASAKFSHIKVGPIGSTFGRNNDDKGGDDEFGDDRRLREAVHV